MTDDTIKLTFNPDNSDLKDIFAYDITRALWCLYRESHMVSDKGLIWLNGLCRLLIKENHTYREKTARKILNVFVSNMNSVEYTMHKDEPDWVDKVVPYLMGKKILKIEIVKL